MARLCAVARLDERHATRRPRRPVAVRRSVAAISVAAIVVLLTTALAGGATDPTSRPAAPLQVEGLRCEYRDTAVDIDTLQPRLSWRLTSDQRCERQTAFQAEVATSVDQLQAGHPDLWDTGIVRSGETLNLAYAGKPLRSLQQCFWKVRVWDTAGVPSPWSQTHSFQTGILRRQDWTARWITAEPAAGSAPARLPLFRRRVVLHKPLRSATLTLCGLGQFELHVNATPVAPGDLLQPGWTDYAKTDLYVTYDITSNLRPGENAVGVMLGNGMYDVPADPTRYARFRHSFGPPTLIALLRLSYLDGTSQTIGTDGSWKTAPGPITFSSIYGGEDFDARLQPTLWDSAGFDDSAWSSATLCNGPGGDLRGSTRSAPPVRFAQRLTPVRVTQPGPGLTVYDLGQNCALIPRVVVQGAAGAVVKISPAELLGPDGLVDQHSMGSPVYFQYTLAGSKPPEIWQPRFSYVGCRYLPIQTFAAPGSSQRDVPVVRQVEGLAVTTSAPALGEFVCSNDLLNRTYGLIRWAQQSNLVSLLTDCPHRERLGWLEQTYLNGPSLMDNFDLAPVFEKMEGDMAEAQHADGLVPDIAPEYVGMSGGFLDSPEWGSAALLVPWQAYQWYGDEKILVDHYATMQRYVAYLGSKLQPDGLLHFGLGDWYDLGPRPPGVAQLTPIAFTATAFYCHDLDVLSKIAAVLHDDARSHDLTRQRDAAVACFNAAFWNPSTHSYATGSQTADAIPLVFGFAPASEETAIVDHLARDIRRRGNARTAGDVGDLYVLRALADHGRSDVVLDMNQDSTRPGYGYQLARGATSLTEAWDADPRSSQNHFMLGHLMEWLYSDLAGISQQPDSVAFSHVRIRPAVVGNVTGAAATYPSARGPLQVSWTKDAARHLAVRVALPPGTTATLDLPAQSPSEVTETGKPLSVAPGVEVSSQANARPGMVSIQLQSGRYLFSSTLPPDARTDGPPVGPPVGHTSPPRP